MVGYSPHSSNADEGGYDDSDEPSLDRVFALLADQRRRIILACLRDHAQAIALADLAEEVAIRETERPIPEIPARHIQEIRLVLHHTHLPKLVEAGAVEYDHERDLIRVTDAADWVERILSLTADEWEV